MQFVDGNKFGGDYASARLGNIVIIGVYLSPNISAENFEHRIRKIMRFARAEKRLGRQIIIGGDFNARSPVWGSENQNEDGNILVQEFLRLGIHPIAPTGGPTFQRGSAVSNLDFIAAYSDLLNNGEFRSWVSEKESASDHRYVISVLTVNEETGTTMSDYRK